jgi:hypothetical protein
MGLVRLKEALEANDWEGGDDFGEDINLEDLEKDNENSEGSVGFGIDASEMEDEMTGMKRAIYGGGEVEDEADQDMEVERLQAMMLKMQAVKGKWADIPTCIPLMKLDMGSDLPEAERKKLAAKTVGEIMKTL